MSVSFLAHLHASFQGVERRVLYLNRGDSLDRGWLVLDRLDRFGMPALFKFEHHRTLEDRILYRITSASGMYEGAKLGISRNGYLGFYELAGAVGIWKVQAQSEWRPEPGQRLGCWLRDHEGHRINCLERYKQSTSPGRFYLNVHDGEPLAFEAEVLKVLQ